MSAHVAFFINRLGFYQARNGEVWRVICLDGNNAEYPIVAMDSKGDPNTFSRDGRIVTKQKSEFDLVNAWSSEAIRFEQWLNIYADKDALGYLHLSREAADKCAQKNRTGVLRIVHIGGELLNADLELRITRENGKLVSAEIES